MKNSKIFFIGLILIFNFTIGVVTVRAEEDDALEDEERTVAKEDTYVEMYNPTANNGGKDWLIVGKLIKPNEAYLYFEFEDEPDNWKEVEISWNPYYVSETMKVEIYLIKTSWDELTLNWINKPNKSKLIETLTVAEGDIYKFEVTDEVEDLLDDDEEGISICMSTDITSSGHFQAHSIEGYHEKDDAPLLIWTYDVVVVDEDFLLAIIVIIIIIAGVVGIVLVVDNRKKKSRETKEPATAIPMNKYQEIEQKKLVEPIDELVGIFCQFCGVKLSKDVKFCTSCGANINE